MEQQAVISNDRLVEFCNRQQRLEDAINHLAEDVRELKTEFAQQRKDFAEYRSDNGDMVARMTAQMDTRCDGICALIGEVPQGESVMGNVRAVNNRVDKMFWAFGIILAVVEFIANFPQIAELFTK